MYHAQSFRLCNVQICLNNINKISYKFWLTMVVKKTPFNLKVEALCGEKRDVQNDKAGDNLMK